MEEIRLFVLLSIFSSSLAAIPVAEFYPFGESQGDSKLPPNDDGSSTPVLISSLFPFFNKQHHNLTVNTNGVISFLRAVSQFTPDPFPLAGDRRLIAPYWADVDIRNGGNVWYKESTNPFVLFQATSEILSHASALNIRDLTNFRATWVFVATWEDVAFYGASTTGKNKRNTFQTVLVTNGRHSFVIFNYAKIEWTTGAASNGDSDTGLGGTPAQIGFNAGDGIKFYNVEGSRTADIINVKEKSNINTPGKFIFRVDDAEIQDGGCNTEGTLTLTPRFGNMLGGHYLYVSGPCFQHNPNVNDLVVATLKFDPNKVVDCLYEDDFTARCVAPPTLFRTGHVQVSLTRQDAQAGNGTFIGYYNPESIVRHPPMLERVQSESWGEGSVMKVCWEPAKVKTQLDCVSDIGRLDVLSYKENINGPHWKFIHSISDSVNINSECYTFPWQGSVSLNSDEKVGILRMSCEREDLDMSSTAVWSDIHDLIWIKEPVRPVSPAEAESICQEWIDRERLLPFLNFTQVSEPCPCQLRQAIIDAGRFHPDPRCNQGSTTSTNCNDYVDAIHCIHSNAPQENTAGQRCCYDSQGELLHEPFQVQPPTSRYKVLRSAGRSSRYHYLGTTPHKANGKVPYLSNYLGDEIPFLECCKHNANSSIYEQQCTEYMRLRPASDCSGYVPPRPAILSGDPHLVTLDGFRYTFNGVGEYVILETRDQSLILQGRTEQAKNSDGHLQPASVFTAVAMKTNESDIVQVQLSEITMVEIIVNGEKQNFETQPWQDFEGVSVFSQATENNTEVTIMFMQDEVAVLLDATRDMMNVIFLGPETIKGTTRGLLGTWNDDATDDLMMSDGSQLPMNSSSSEIHNFGLSWTIELSTSLFSYTQGRTFTSYQNPAFVPLFPEDILNSNSVTDEHRNVCGNNTQCLFDFVTTGNKAIAEKTKQANVLFQETVEAATFVVRCPTLDRPENGQRAVTGYKVGDNVTYRCDTGYALDGAQNRFCLNNGTWSSVAPFCKIQSCDSFGNRYSIIPGSNCARFHQEAIGSNPSIQYDLPCPVGLQFNTANCACDWPRNVHCLS